MWSPLIVFCAVVGAVAMPVNEKRLTLPTVTIQNGTIVGSTTGSIDTFDGIPFAQPPVGDLRLRRPRPITSSYGTITATGVPTACPQLYVSIDETNIPEEALGLVLTTPLVQEVTVTGEDCLTLNVQRPAGTSSNASLPVVFWIFGGGFELGSTQTYNADALIAQSVALGHPIIYVEVNYRVSGFGFLGGSELQADGSTNLGLREQRLGLEWVAENIAAFGGDPSKVTVWGESAGAISVFDHTIINGGDNTYNGKSLFRGAIMNSGSVVPTLDVNSSKAQNIYDIVVDSAGCSGSADTLSCLRALPYETFLEAVNSAPAIFSYSGLNLAYLPRPDPSDIFFSASPPVPLYAGDHAKVPIIIGDQEDEGTLFSLVQINLTTAAQVDAYFATDFPETDVSITNGLSATYPDDPSAGSPFRTGALNEIRPQFSRLAAITGDAVFNLRRRQYLDVVSSVVPAWSYLDSHLYGLAVLGTFHASDILEYYDDTTSLVTATTYMNYCISCFNYLDPNVLGTAAPLIEWPQYSTASSQLVRMNALNNDLIQDTFRKNSSDYLEMYPYEFRV